jgi:hypothetical protein
MGILGLIAASAFAGDALDTVASAGVSKSAAVQAVRGRAEDSSGPHLQQSGAVPRRAPQNGGSAGNIGPRRHVAPAPYAIKDRAGSAIAAPPTLRLRTNARRPEPLRKQRSMAALTPSSLVQASRAKQDVSTHTVDMGIVRRQSRPADVPRAQGSGIGGPVTGRITRTAIIDGKQMPRRRS